MKPGIRIIGGKYRGKKLSVPEALGLRPTTARVRETLFNWLMRDIAGARCLDAFAGSGALGFEALSRGASEVVLLENNPKVYAHLQKTAAQFSDPAVHVLLEDALRFMARQNVPFDIVFLDPPFAKQYWSDCIDALLQGACLGREALLYVEAAQDWTLDDERLQCLKCKQAGQVSYRLYQRKAGGRSS
ncbi:MAG: 16S rRNA (guanine(966)-N(2))-methyltransferase RsmD [Legionellaceae bacterium]|nr:16S rRNA (guanine(966)-N(2))-methyltransferase RsmD [Legionellaceae bacterium]